MPGTTRLGLAEAAESYSGLERAIARHLTQPERRTAREPTVFTERLLHCVWYDGHFHTDGLRAADGRSLEIRRPGRWNGEAGPDFLKAELVLDGEPLNGDVELHLRASDWKRHGHASDPNYRGVVLHVVLDIDDGLEADPMPTGREIPRLELRSALHGDLDAIREVLSAEDLPHQSPAMVGRCQPVLSRLDHDAQVTAFFEAAAARRIRAKMDRLASQLGDESDFEQVLYQALMTAMGHRGSKTLFFLLAKRVPVAELRSLTQPWSGRERALAAQAVLLHVANLVRAPADGAEPWDDATMRHVDAVNRVWGELGGHFTDRIIAATRQWHRGMRPTSFPSRRIAGMSHLMVGELGLGEGLFANLVGRCGSFATDELSEKAVKRHLKALVNLLAVEEPNDFWATRHTLGGKRLANPQRLVGQGLARSVLFNAFLPLALLWARRRKERSLAKWIEETLRHFPPLEPNVVTRFMKYRVFGTPDPPKSLFQTELRHQALFHIFTDCCDSSTTSCDQCAFFARLTR